MKITFISSLIVAFLLTACTLTTTFNAPSIEQSISESDWIQSIAPDHSPQSTIAILQENTDLPDEHGTVVYVSSSSTDVTGFISVWFDLKKLLSEGVNDILIFSIDVLQTKLSQATVTMNVYYETESATSLTPIATELLDKNQWHTIEASYAVPEDPASFKEFLLGIKALDPATLDFYVDDLKIEVQFSGEGTL